MKLKFVFFDWDDDVVNAYKKELAQYENLYSINYDTGDIKKVLSKNNCTCVVSPANSFGEMNGGIDYYISKMFPDVQDNVKNDIKKYSISKSQSGCYVIPVGESILCDTGDKHCPNIFVAPTMFMPKNIVGTDNVYKAFLSILDNFSEKDFVVGVPGLGTGVGNVSPKDCAKQVALAFKHHAEKKQAIKNK